MVSFMERTRSGDDTRSERTQGKLPLLDENDAFDHVHRARIRELARLGERHRDLDGLVERQLLLDLLAVAELHGHRFRTGRVGGACEREHYWAPLLHLQTLGCKSLARDADLESRW